MNELRNLERMNALDDMALEMVAGGITWPGIPPLDPFNPFHDSPPPAPVPLRP